MMLYFKQKTAYEMRISDWSSDVCSSDLAEVAQRIRKDREGQLQRQLDALQAGAGTVDGRPEFELAPRIAAVDDRLIGGRPRRQQRERQAAVGIGALEAVRKREAFDILREQRHRRDRPRQIGRAHV